MKISQSKMAVFTGLLVGLLAAVILTPVLADDKITYELTIKDHRFEPEELRIPANKPAILRVKNIDAQAEEFESHDLKIEKVIAGNSEGIIYLRALKAGSYEFEGEYHERTAHGVLIVE